MLVIFEGRDASGMDGTIKRIVAHMSPREARVVALGKPSDRDRVGFCTGGEYESFLKDVLPFEHMHEAHAKAGLLGM